MTETPIRIDVVSDVVCPWCFIGLKNLELARANATEITTAVAWRPYQLDGSIPAAGVDRTDYMLQKFGSQQRIDDAHERLESLGRNLGIVFDFKAIKVSPNTLDAHRLIRWAGEIGVETQGHVVAALFSAYFEQGLDIGNHAVLLTIGQENGLDGTVIAALLATDANKQDVQDEIATVSRMGVTGVPCYLLEGKYVIVGAQDPAVLADAFRQIHAMRANEGADK